MKEIEKLRRILQAVNAEKQTLENHLVAQKEANSVLMAEAAQAVAVLASSPTKEQVDNLKEKHKADLEIAKKKSSDQQIIQHMNEQMIRAGKRVREWNQWTESQRSTLGPRRSLVEVGPNDNFDRVKCCLEIIWSLGSRKSGSEMVQNHRPATGLGRRRVSLPCRGSFLRPRKLRQDTEERRKIGCEFNNCDFLELS